MEFILDRLLLPVLFGAVGWFATHFVIKPILAFHDLRQRAHEAVFFTANVTDDPALVSGGPERFAQAVAELRRLAAKLTALDVAANWMAHAYFRACGYAIGEAAVAVS